MASAIERMTRWLNQRDNFALITHMHPDGDALGSSLALCMALRIQGKRAFVCCQDEAPPFLSMLPTSGQLYLPEEIPFEPETVVCVDCAAANRFGRAALLIQPNRPLACIDHHEDNDICADVAYIEANAAASGELIMQLIDALGVEFTRDMAVCLYVALSTDTGNFAFGSTTPYSLRAAARCVELGIDVDRLNYELFRKRSPARTRLLGQALHGIRFLLDGRLALMELRLTDFAACKALQADTEGIVDYGINTEGVQIAVLAAEQQADVKFSLRSRGEVNVARMLRSLGGGGHERAAGVTLALPYEEALEAVLSAARHTLGE